MLCQFKRHSSNFTHEIQFAHFLEYYSACEISCIISSAALGELSNFEKITLMISSCSSDLIFFLTESLCLKEAGVWEVEGSNERKLDPQ